MRKGLGSEEQISAVLELQRSYPTWGISLMEPTVIWAASAPANPAAIRSCRRSCRESCQRMT
eukprot:673120-Hanusia_phi.AAC.1